METDFIKKIIEDTLLKIPVHAEIKEVSVVGGGDIVKFSVHTDDPHFLIGADGKTLLALNHLIKKIVEKQSATLNHKKISFIVDVNDYQEKKIQELKNRAQIMAERARFFKSNIECPPMNPYERMIIHSFFTDIPDIKTESTGKGMERRVVVKYVNQE
mgnify:FL=1